MGYIVEITESKMEHLAENAEKMLRYGGKVMQCIDELREQSGHMGERGGGYGERGYGERGYGSGGRYGMREDDYDDDRMGERYGNRWDDGYGERRGRSPYTGRYVSR